MDELWKKRLTDHQKRQFKYLRLVFNDNLVIALIFMMGGLALAYANLLKAIKPDLWWEIPLIILICLASLSIGRLATLLEDADAVFLLPKEGEFFSYFLKARRYSLALPLFGIIVIVGILAPFMLVVAHFDMLEIIGIVLTLFLLKDMLMWINVMYLYVPQHRPIFARKPLFYLLSLLLLILGFYLTPVIGLLGALLLNVYVRTTISGTFAKGGLRWQESIMMENTRMFRLYRFYNLFTDVPGMQGGVKRRKWLDFMYHLVPLDHQHTYGFMYLRGFLRGTEYSGLFLRLMIIGAVVLYFIPNIWLSLAILLLFLYLVGFQLLPFYRQFDDVIFTHLYPISNSDKQKAFTKLFIVVLMIQLVIMIIPTFFILKSAMVSVLFLVIGIVGIMAFASLYLPVRLKKLDNNY